MSAAMVDMPDRLAWLFGSNLTPPDGSLADEAVLDEAWALLSDNWQVIPLTGPRLLAWASPKLGQSPSAIALRDRMASVVNFARVQLKVCERFIHALHAAGVPYALLKGSAVRFTAYADPTDRCGKDIDLLTPRRYLGLAQQVAGDIGFVASQWNPEMKRFHRADPVRRAEVEAEHYELGFLVRRQVVDGLLSEDEAAIRRDMPSHYLWHEANDGRLACYVSTDIHHALSLDLPAEDLFHTVRTVRTEAGAISVPSPAWFTLHVIFKLYWEGVHTYKKGLYQYTDLLLHMRLMSERDQRELLELLAEHQLEVAAYYVLRRLETDLGETFPDILVEFLEQQAFTPQGEEVDARALNDMGDMWPKLWGYR
jgi:hypothetical protein